MNEKPILFSTEMVKAILAGRKTQTRRVIRPQPNGIGKLNDEFFYFQDNNGKVFMNPYGSKGDQLWVRETFAKLNDYKGNDCGPRALKYNGFFKADHPAGIYNEDLSEMKWRPSIFMPRDMSRIDLIIKNIRVERVQDITHDDAVAEGFYRIEPCKQYPNGNAWGRVGFSGLWDTINAKRGYSWDSNPWVWVIEFERVE